MVKRKSKLKVKPVPISVGVLEAGRASDFWKLICQAIDASVEELKLDLRNPELISLPSTEYKLRVELINGKIDHLEHLKETPDNLIQSVLDDKPEEDPDPYQKV